MAAIWAWIKSWVVTPVYSPFARANYILDLIDDESVWQLLSSDTDTRVVDVDLAHNATSESLSASDNYVFKMRWSDLLHRNCPLVVFFPNNPDKNTKVLYTDKASSLPDLDLDINTRLGESKIRDTDNMSQRRTVDTLLMAICCGPYVYRVWNINTTHNLYIYWLTHLNQYNALGQSAPIVCQVPTLVEMDGYGKLVNLIPLNYKPKRDSVLRQHAPLNLAAHRGSYIRARKNGDTLFNLERDVRQTFNKHVVTASDTRAVSHVRSIDTQPSHLHRVAGQDAHVIGAMLKQQHQEKGNNNNNVHYMISSSDQSGDTSEDGSSCVSGNEYDGVLIISRQSATHGDSDLVEFECDEGHISDNSNIK